MTQLDTCHDRAPAAVPGTGAAGERRFPTGFVWGAATSAYQIEGGVDLDGRGPSIWDSFAASGRARGHTGDVAADHRRRMADDVALMAQLGLPTYRFSISWPRVQPEGRGRPNVAGLDFYRDLVDELLAHGIEPVVTAYHWDLPQALEDEGGWPRRDTALRFADYADLVGRALGDRVDRWSTVNEPWCAAMLGYAAGVHAPGRTDPGAAVAAAHHLLLGHGLAVDVLRAHVPDDRAEIGITLNPYPVVPATASEADADAARRVDGLANRLWYDAVLLGRYPDDVLDDLAPISDLAHVRDRDLAKICRPIDALGLNYYRRHHVRHRPGASASPSPWPG
ncbi:MAG TPA: family 1 glycosylhydrolase, partial [Acidimicrobiales bacterium]